MLSIKKKKINYDKKYDTLYYCMFSTANSYGDDIDGNIVLMRDMDTEQITGVTIIGYKKHFKNNNEKRNFLSNYIDINPIIKTKNI